MTTKPKGKKKHKRGAHARDAVTGEFTTLADAKARPGQTVVERTPKHVHVNGGAADIDQVDNDLGGEAA